MTRLTKQEFHIRITSDDKTAVDYLANTSGLSRQKLKQTMQKGCVWLERVKTELEEYEIGDAGKEVLAVDVTEDNSGESNAVEDCFLEKNSQENSAVKEKPIKKIKQQSQAAFIQRLRRAKKVVKKRDILHFYYDESVLESETLPAVLVEDFGAYSVWNKPSGMLSQGSKWGDHTTIYRFVEKQLQPERPAFIVHRLDKAAHGLIIIAHKKSVASQFSRMFEQHEIEKRYQVKVAGDFSTMIPIEAVRLTISDKIESKTATSHVRIVSFDTVENTSMLEVQIETGRKHQIRKHLLGVGFPVVGDRLYAGGGYKVDKSAETEEQTEVDLQLQAKYLSFVCPLTSEKREFTLKS